MIEQETKIVLIPNSVQVLTEFSQKMGWWSSRIEQFYLDGRTRIRSRESMIDGSFKFTFTYKIPHGKNSAIEFEREITKEEFGRLMQYSIQSLSKTRYTNQQTTGIIWDLDIFQYGETEFVMLEVEYEEEIPDISWIPKELILKKVEKNSEFSSRKLCDEEYAQKKLVELKWKKK